MASDSVNALADLCGESIRQHTIENRGAAQPAFGPKGVAGDLAAALPAEAEIQALGVAAGLSLLGAMVAIGMRSSSKSRAGSEQRQEAPLGAAPAIAATQD